MTTPRVGIVAAVGLLVASCASSEEPTGGPLVGDHALVVAAASDLRPAFEEIGAMYTAETGDEVIFDFGSSGQLAQRILEGASVDVYASADAGFVDRVVEGGRGDPLTATAYALGRIVIWSRADSGGSWETLEEVANDAGVRFVAIANPQHAPYGRAARQALQAAGAWEAVQPKLVLGENISDTHRLADAGEADVAIGALSLAIAAGERGRWALVDDSLHDPLEQTLVVVADRPVRQVRAGEFVTFVNGPIGQAVLDRFGFSLPDREAGAG